jgi:GNAT superfamily N-acetyltransferase
VSWEDRYQPRREPDRTLRPMSPHDIPAAVALLQSMGWKHEAKDWARLLAWSPDGCFVIEEVERGIIGTVSTTPYGTEQGWIGMMLIAPDRQRQGLGRQLMRAALDHLIARGTERIMLDASEAGRPLYRSMGFRDLYNVEHWEGKASTYLGARARPMRPEDVDAVLELDARLYGFPRRHILVRLLEEFPDLAWVDVHKGRLEGYLLGRRMADSVDLGPWMSASAASAERLLLIALEQLQGQTVTLNIPDSNSRGIVLASDHNLQRVWQTTRMAYGDRLSQSGEPLAELAVTSLATG